MWPIVFEEVKQLGEEGRKHSLIQRLLFHLVLKLCRQHFIEKRPALLSACRLEDGEASPGSICFAYFTYCLRFVGRSVSPSMRKHPVAACKGTSSLFPLVRRKPVVRQESSIVVYGLHENPSFVVAVASRIPIKFTGRAPRPAKSLILSKTSSLRQRRTHNGYRLSKISKKECELS